VLRAAGETETARENIQHWLQLDEGDPGYQHFYITLMKFSIYLFSEFFCLLGLSFATLIRIIG
jgi:hypothetical protein